MVAGAATVVGFSAPVFDTRSSKPKEGTMGLWDRLMGRGKKTAGDAMGDSSMRSEGMHQEQQGMAEDRAASAEQMAQDERERAAEHQSEREGM
jgi:uncharacterized protein YjbJ (UPF0337 family)